MVARCRRSGRTDEEEKTAVMSIRTEDAQELAEKENLLELNKTEKRRLSTLEWMPLKKLLVF